MKESIPYSLYLLSSGEFWYWLACLFLGASGAFMTRFAGRSKNPWKVRRNRVLLGPVLAGLSIAAFTAGLLFAEEWPDRDTLLLCGLWFGIFFSGFRFPRTCGFFWSLLLVLFLWLILNQHLSFYPAHLDEPEIQLKNTGSRIVLVMDGREFSLEGVPDSWRITTLEYSTVLPIPGRWYFLEISAGEKRFFYPQRGLMFYPWLSEWEYGSFFIHLEENEFSAIQTIPVQGLFLLTPGREFGIYQ